jgi:hypothetical protein
METVRTVLPDSAKISKARTVPFVGSGGGAEVPFLGAGMERVSSGGSYGSTAGRPLSFFADDIPERINEYQYGPSRAEKEREQKRQAILRSLQTSSVWHGLSPRGRQSCETLLGYANGAGEVRITMAEFRSNFEAGKRGTPKADSHECWRTARRRISELEDAGVVVVSKLRLGAYKTLLVLRFARRFVGRALSWLKKVTQRRRGGFFHGKEGLS